MLDWWSIFSWFTGKSWWIYVNCSYANLFRDWTVSHSVTVTGKPVFLQIFSKIKVRSLDSVRLKFAHHKTNSKALLDKTMKLKICNWLKGIKMQYNLFLKLYQFAGFKRAIWSDTSCLGREIICSLGLVTLYVECSDHLLSKLVEVQGLKSLDWRLVVTFFP